MFELNIIAEQRHTMFKDYSSP